MGVHVMKGGEGGQFQQRDQFIVATSKTESNLDMYIAIVKLRTKWSYVGIRTDSD